MISQIKIIVNFLGNWFAGEDGENNTFSNDSDSDTGEEIQKDEIFDVELM